MGRGSRWGRGRLWKGRGENDHRHGNTSETVAVLLGKLVWEYYDELERRCTERIELSAGGSVGALNVPLGRWDKVMALESGLEEVPGQARDEGCWPGMKGAGPG